MQIEIGQTVGDYQVLSHLGSGGMGGVYKVRHLISDRVEAMKVLLTPSADDVLSERFRREIRTLAALQHPNIAVLHTAVRYEDQVLMLMEYVEGETVRSRLARSWLPAVESIRLIADVLAALEYAHARGVIHRDVKPSNIMITDNGAAKLLDFGLAFRDSDHNLTRCGTVMGSLQYMSPEQVLGDPADARSDLYSATVTLYEMLAGRAPYDQRNDFELMRAHLEGEPTPLHVANSAIPRELSDIVRKGMARDAAKRFQTAAELAGALRPFLRKSADNVPTRMFAREQSSAGTSASSQRPTPLRSTSASAESKMTAGAETRPQSDSHVMPIDDQNLAIVSRELAEYVGPIAKVLVHRAASKCANLHDLYIMLSDEIESDSDRMRFLANRHNRR